MRKTLSIVLSVSLAAATTHAVPPRPWGLGPHAG